MEYEKEISTCDTVKSLIAVGDLGINSLILTRAETNPYKSLYSYAISNNDNELFEYLLGAEADPNIRSGDLETPLHHLALAKDIDEFRRLSWASKLILAGANVNVDIKPGDGMTPLFLAVSCRHYDLAQILIFHGADVNVRKNTGIVMTDFITPLYVSHSANNKMVELLLRNNAWTNIRAPNKYQTPLIDAIKYGGMERIKLLVVYGADVNFTTGIDNWNVDESPLHIAVKESFREVVKLLLGSAEINVNAVTSNGESVLHYAARYLFSNTEIVKDLLDAGVDVNIVNNQGETASSCVNDGGNPVIAELRQYIVKLQIAGFHINIINSKTIEDNKYETFRQDCLREIEILKKTLISSSNITFYRVMHSSEAESSAYLKHIDKDQLRQSLEELDLQVYHGKLLYILDSINARIFLLEDTEWLIYKSLIDKLPHTCLRCILDYFNFQDLKYLRDKLSSSGKY